MIRRLAAATTRNLNQFPVNKEISPKYNPLLIITRYDVADYKLLSIDFEVYAEICKIIDRQLAQINFVLHPLYV